MVTTSRQLVDFQMIGGLPYNKVFRVPGVRITWPDISVVEIRSQLRTGKTTNTGLIANLHQFMSMGYDDMVHPNDLLVIWTMTGEETKAIGKSGYFDVILSDDGVTDAKAISFFEPTQIGHISWESLVTRNAGSL